MSSMPVFDPRWVISGSEDGQIFVWNLQHANVAQSFSAHNGSPPFFRLFDARLTPLSVSLQMRSCALHHIRLSRSLRPEGMHTIHQSNCGLLLLPIPVSKRLYLL